MSIKNNISQKTLSLIFFILSSIGIISILLLDIAYWKTGIIPEGKPDFSFSHLMRSASIILAVAFFFIGLFLLKKQHFVKLSDNGTVFEKFSVLGTISLSIIFLIIFILDAITFNYLSQEDRLIEWVSAIFLFCSSMIFIAAFVKTYQNKSVPIITKVIFIFFAIVFLLIAMEEISWFQRIFNYETPAYFENNRQNEFNLHNFVTNPSENIYYFGSFLFLVVYSFLNIPFPKLRDNYILKTFSPTPQIAILGAIACSYNYDMWNIVFTQITFYGSVIVLSIFAILVKGWKGKYLFLSSILVILLTQFLYIYYGDNFLREWDVTEYKEFFIPLAFLIYSISLYRKVSISFFSKKAISG